MEGMGQMKVSVLNQESYGWTWGEFWIYMCLGTLYITDGLIRVENKCYFVYLHCSPTGMFLA